MRAALLAVMGFVFSFSAATQELGIIRFTKDQIDFRLQEMEGDVVPCQHRLLTHVPWWEVRCGSRVYTVNTWVQLLRNPQEGIFKSTFMFDVSEGVQSSGEPLVRFQSHITSFVVRDLGSMEQLNSSLDVRNGLTSLEITVDLRK